MTEQKKEAMEVFKIKFSARSLQEAGSIFRQQAAKLFGSPDLKALDLGLPDKFLQIDGPQPSLAELTVVANKLKMQITLTHIELKTVEQVETEKAAAENKK